MLQTGYKLEHCRPNCSKAARNWHNLYDLLNKTLSDLSLPQILKDRFDHVLHHHLPKICLAGCPNGCSQPNIKDFGISGYVIPRITSVPCSGCRACVRACSENAIICRPGGVIIDYTRCLNCGDCQRACKSGTLAEGESGWELRLGGRVGRHPQFAGPAGRVSTDEEAAAWVSEILLQYIEQGQPHERLTNFLDRSENRTSQLIDEREWAARL